MKKIILSLGVIAIVAVGAIGATRSFFSDTETSTGNTFTAGAIDLKIDSHATYNNQEVAGSTWAVEKDLVTGDKFFNFSDIKPGDVGENTISLHVINNDAYVCATVSNLTDNENGINEPESSVDTTPSTGELSSTMLWKVWKDDGDNIWETGETVLAEGHPTNGTLALYDSTTGAPLSASGTGYLGVSWTLPSASGNETQTDSMTGDISFQVVQSRNNTGFVCGQGQVSQNEETDWQVFNVTEGAVNHISSGTGGISSTQGSKYATTSGDAFTHWGAYNTKTVPYTTSVDVYLDMDEATMTPTDTAYFDFSSAINNISGTHLRDFIFHVGHNPSTGNWSATVSNNSNNDSTIPQGDQPQIDLASPANISTTGWYTLQSYFHDNGSGLLVVDMKILDSSNVVVGSWTILTTDNLTAVGGNRYGWFTAQPFPSLKFDNAKIY